jgi:hypothetical protein
MKMIFFYLFCEKKYLELKQLGYNFYSRYPRVLFEEPETFRIYFL